MPATVNKPQNKSNQELDFLRKTKAVDIATNTPAQVNVHLNDLLGRQIGVDNLEESGTVDAIENWWGSPRGPGTRGATTVNGTGVDFTPWLTRPNLELP